MELQSRYGSSFSQPRRDLDADNVYCRKPMKTPFPRRPSDRTKFPRTRFMDLTQGLPPDEYLSDHTEMIGSA